jgi:hypothetical protein
MKQLLSVLIVFLALTSCQKKKIENTAYIKVKVEGLTEYEFSVRRGYGDKNPFNVNLKNGELQCEIPNVTEPEMILFNSTEEGVYYAIRLFIEAGENSYEGKLVPWEHAPKEKHIVKTKIVGSKANQYSDEWRDGERKLRDQLTKNMEGKSKDEYYKYDKIFRDDLEKWQFSWVKNHPNEWFSAFQADVFLSSGTDVETHELLLSYLDPNMDNKHVTSLKEKLKNLKSTDVKLEDLIKAKNVHYKVDQSYKGSDYKNVTYMAAIDGNKVCMLNKSGEFKIVDARGKLVNSFQPATKSPASSFAVNANNEIYALAPNYKTIVKKHRGREIKKQVVEGVECIVMDAMGTEKKRFQFKGLGSASGAKFMNDQLIVSDFGTAKLYVYDANTGEKKSEIADMRPCCGILDFCIGENNQLLVADLGAFRVQGYKLDGDKILAFGKRGRGMDEFHGCCNPVNVGRLSNGAIVTVEKSPTRIKIYSQEGARLIEGVEELVKGCAYIPMAIDNVDNLYLASPEKGLVKCVAKV